MDDQDRKVVFFGAAVGEVGILSVEETIHRDSCIGAAVKMSAACCMASLS